MKFAKIKYFVRTTTIIEAVLGQLGVMVRGIFVGLGLIN